MPLCPDGDGKVKTRIEAGSQNTYAAHCPNDKIVSSFAAREFWTAVWRRHCRCMDKAFILLTAASGGRRLFLLAGLTSANAHNSGRNMRESTLAAVVVMAACAAHAAGAAEQVLPDLVVTPTGQEVSSMRIGHSVSTVTAADIAAHGWRTLPEALQAIPGLHINQSGAPGSTVGLVLRGSRSSQVLVLVDGIRLNDASGPTREADIAAIDLANVERIEVLRGPQSGLYGSDAIAGVINIITKSTPTGLSGSVAAEAGSFGTYRASAELRSGAGKISAAASASYLASDGFSSANSRFPGNDEKDGFETLNASASLGVQASEWLRLEGRLQVIDAEADYDNGGGPGADARNNVATTEQVLTGIRAAIGDSTAAWRQSLSLNYTAIERKFDDEWGIITYKGDNIESEWRHDIQIGKANTLSTGVNYREEAAKAGTDGRVTADNIGVYIQDHVTCGPFDAIAGLRYDRHEEFGGELTWRAAPSYRVARTGTRFKGSVGTGFKAPSLYQLYAPASAWGAVGNPDLDPEMSLGWDAGIEQALFSERVTVGATYFASRVEDQIEFANGYENVSRVDSEGVEVYASCRPVDMLRLTASYTRTEAKDHDSGQQLTRVPKDRAALAASADLSRRVNVSTTVICTGAFDDRYYDASMFTSVDARVESSVVVNLAANVAVSDRVTVFGRIDNLFDEDYETVYGFGTAGVSGYGGLKVTL